MAAGTGSADTKLQQVLPGLLTYSSYALAVRASDSVIINGTGEGMTGYTTAAAANPGDVLSIFATGLGPTRISVAPGLVFSGTYYETADLPGVTIGGVNAEVMFCGMVAVGLYQINLRAPATLAEGTHAVVVTSGGVSSPAAVAMMRFAAK